MLIFLTFRYTKAFAAWKRKAAQDPDFGSSQVGGTRGGAQSPTEGGGTRRTSKSVRWGELGTERTSTQAQTSILKNQGKRAQNVII